MAPMHAILEYWVKNENYTGETTILSKMADIIKVKICENDLDEVWGSEVNLCFPSTICWYYRFSRSV